MDSSNRWAIYGLALLLSSTVGLPSPIRGQHGKTILGHVKNWETAEPLEGANVFLSNTLIGTSTDSTGAFLLVGVPSGIYDLIVSRIGFDRQVLRVPLIREDTLAFLIRLQPGMVNTSGIDVSASIPEAWQEHLEQFIRTFVGNANDCRILNPYVLNFSRTSDTLIARADSMVRIENWGLGFRLKIVLAEFVWNVHTDNGHYVVYPLFEPLIPHDNRQQASWDYNRKQAYDGSLKHFLHSLCVGDAEGNLFRIYSGSLRHLLRGQGHIIHSGELDIRRVEEGPLWRLQFPGWLRIEYGLRSDDEQVQEGKYRGNATRLNGSGDLTTVSLVELRGSEAFFDSLGNLIDPLSLELAGGWAQRRVSELLPSH